MPSRCLWIFKAIFSLITMNSEQVQKEIFKKWILMYYDFVFFCSCITNYHKTLKKTTNNHLLSQFHWVRTLEQLCWGVLAQGSGNCSQVSAGLQSSEDSTRLEDLLVSSLRLVTVGGRTPFLVTVLLNTAAVMTSWHDTGFSQRK